MFVVIRQKLQKKLAQHGQISEEALYLLIFEQENWKFKKTYKK